MPIINLYTSVCFLLLFSYKWKLYLFLLTNINHIKYSYEYTPQHVSEICKHKPLPQRHLHTSTDHVHLLVTMQVILMHMQATKNSLTTAQPHVQNGEKLCYKSMHSEKQNSTQLFKLVLSLKNLICEGKLYTHKRSIHYRPR